MKDLLGSIKPDSDNGDNPFYHNDDNGGGDVEMQSMPDRGDSSANKSPHDQALDDFFREVAAVKGALERIKKDKKKLNDLHEQSKGIAQSKKVQRLQQDMQSCINDVNKAAKLAKAKVELLDKMNEQAASHEGNEAGTSNDRMRTSVTNGLKKKLRELMGDFQTLRTKIQEEYRDVVERRVQLVTGEKPTEEQVERMIETGEGESIFKKAIMESGRGQIVDTLAEIQERHSAVKELEKSLLELHQLFLDMAVLVDAQGEMLDNIENQVAKSKEYVEAGAVHVVQARELQKSTRKYMCYAVICVVILIVLLFAFFGGFRVFG